VCALTILVARETAAQSLPSGWQTIDIASTSGSASVNSSGTWTVTGSGANIWGTQDQFRFAYRSVTGDMDIVARVASLTASNEWAKAGIMIRDSLNPNARNAFMLLSPGIGAAFQQRASTGGTTARVSGGSAAWPVWVRLSRRGNLFTASRSADGQSWKTVSTATISMPAATFVGLAVTARDANLTATATMSNVSIEQSATSESTSSPSTATWSNSDVGSPITAGSSTISSGTYTVSGAGWDIWDNRDEFQYLYQRVTGDVEIIARLEGITGADEWWSKAGVMLRESLAAGSRHALMAGTGRSGWAFQRRLLTDGTSYHTSGPITNPPGWVRLVREGNLFTAYYSTNGSSWTIVGTDTIAMGSTIYAGLAVSASNTLERANGTFTNVTVRAASTGTNQPPSVTLTAPSSGATFTAGATVSFAASASDSDGSVARVEFYRGSTLVSTDTTTPYAASWTGATAGTYSLTAVAYDDDGASSTSPAVSVTVNGSSNQLPNVSLTSPTASQTFTAPANVYVAATASDPDGSIARVDLYQGSTLLKSDSTSPYSFSWTSVPAGTYQLTAVARDNAGATRTSTPVTITVNAPGNQLPTVAISTPATGASFAAPANITIQATAGDADGTIARVEFYRGSTLISTDTSSPYAATWSSAPAGSYALTARAFDNAGGSQTSAVVNVTVTSSTNQPPTVSITSPASGAGFTAPALVSMAANASDPDGSVMAVDFYAGSQLIGTDTSSPYTATWNNVAAGTYSLTAVARDNSGATRTSSAVSITVNASGTRPTSVEFNASADHSTTRVTSYVVALYRSTDPITAVPVATRDLGKPTPVSGVITVDISTLVNPLPAGTYYAVVRAVGSGGTSASAPSATFTK
jgi:regulation of enolase protein 1 (concanavalin A-like superfamily)